MISDEQKKQIENEVDAISAKFIDELRQHKAEIRESCPGMDDDRLLFEGWVIQKIAGLQRVVMQDTNTLWDMRSLDHD